ncbi:hypothetical protein AMECASPLE_027137 [Ameca splendens]|uniref:Uncharacterized protein n=1 Tax=Ameca splendens TaxID=208324 RepID=A0ABV0Y5N7_9TELE
MKIKRKFNMEKSQSPPASCNYSSMRLCSTNQRQVRISPRPIILQGCALKDLHPWNPPFASNVATSASSLRSPGAQPAPWPLPPGVHLSNARPSLSLGEMHHSISFSIPLSTFSYIQAFSVSHFSFSLRQILCFHTFYVPLRLCT